MIIINSFKSIFETDNWFYNDTTKRFFYCNSNITIKNVYLSFPFKNDIEFNKKIIIFFNKFMNELMRKIPNNDNKRISYFVPLTPNDKKTIIFSLKTNIYSDTWIKIPWERI